MGHAGEPSHEILEQAAEWYALLRSEEADAGDRERWQAWMATAAEHRRAWGYVESVSRHFATLQTAPDPRGTAEELWKANGRMMQRRRALGSLVAVVGIGLAGWLTWRSTPLPYLTRTRNADYRTATGEIREIALPDGSRVWLNTATAIREAYDARYRTLSLIEGEILIDTASDPSRPFVVETPQGRLRALGTRFAVRRRGESSELSVHAGAVEIATQSGAWNVVPAGRRTHFTHDGIAPLAPTDSAGEAWSRGVLIVEDMRLGELVEELRRYRSGHLGLSPSVADLKVFGSFPIDDTDATLDMLASALPIRIQRRLPWWVSIEPQADSD